MPPEPATPTVVQRAAFPPGKCLITHDIDGPFLDCGIKFEVRGYWNRMYLHLPWIEEQARKHLGMVPRSELAALKDEKAALEDELEALQMAFDALHGAKQEVAA